MNRKKWTPKTEITEELLKFREKRKWQLALRRYVLEKKGSLAYAPYFGIDVEGFREWISLQFSDGLNWDNFGSDWQFEHIIPVNFFDFSDEAELRLCWNFMNLRVVELEPDKPVGAGINLLAVKSYFLEMYNKTGFEFYHKMLLKIDKIQDVGINITPNLENFIISNTERLNKLSNLNEEEFSKLNQGISLKDILFEREILSKFGS